jgi:FXSXX-COOH protein
MSEERASEVPVEPFDVDALTLADLDRLDGTVLGTCLLRVLEEADSPPGAVARHDSMI